VWVVSGKQCVLQRQQKRKKRMIAGDRKALKATLTHGISDILQEVVDLYSINLNQLGQTYREHSSTKLLLTTFRGPDHCVSRVGVHSCDGPQFLPSGAVEQRVDHVLRHLLLPDPNRHGLLRPGDDRLHSSELFWPFPHSYRKEF
jgi:hypothetical protein